MTEKTSIGQRIDVEPAADDGGGWGVLDELPGNPMMWILIISELLVFSGFFISFAFVRILDPVSFTQSQMQLDALWGGLNTMVLITSGLFCALAVLALEKDRIQQTRSLLLGAIVLGAVFCGVKFVEYSDKFAQGIGLGTNDFFTLFFLMTGFHFLHVVLGMGLLALGAWRPRREVVETVCAFWHMVDLIWILLYPLVYLAR